MTNPGEMAPHRIDAVLFDLDGTLVDSSAVTAAAIIETLAEFGRDVTLEQIRANGGRTLRGWFTGDLSLAPDAAEAAYWRYVETITARAALSTPMPGASALLADLRMRRVPLALVTNRLSQIAAPIIESAGWAGWFDVVVGQETAERTKPAPDPALYALAAIGASAKNSAYVGDTEADMRCAAAAGIRLRIGLAGECSADSLTAAGATHVVNSLEGLRPQLRDAPAPGRTSADEASAIG